LHDAWQEQVDIASNRGEKALDVPQPGALGHGRGKRSDVPCTKVSTVAVGQFGLDAVSPLPFHNPRRMPRPASRRLAAA
jgi:hypothetical protein